MANPEHVAVVRGGKDAIAKWRRSNPKLPLDLREAGLDHAQLGEANLSRADLTGALLWNTNLDHANLSHADLSSANLLDASLFEGDLRRTKLTAADLSGAVLAFAKLRLADLSAANLTAANLLWADLRRANLTGADLTVASLNTAQLERANLSEATLSSTSLAYLDLSRVAGLATVRHESPSSVAVDTLIRSFRGAGNKLTPDLEAFFRGAGVPLELLEALPGIVGEVKYYSCFISYGQPDVKFAEQLRHDLVARGVSCWVYPRDATVGARSWHEIGTGRREAEKMVVLCSAEGLTQPGLVKEIEEQIDDDPDKLVPVSLDDVWRKPGFKVMRDSRDLKPFLVERNYADFANLPYYEQALERLLAGLRRKGD